MNFGGFIKNRRIQLNLTQAEISSFLHITPQGLSNYENGKTKVPLSLVLDLCASLKLDINDFFLLKENAPNSNPDLTDYNFDNISKNIAFLRESNKLTLKELSKNVNISIKDYLILSLIMLLHLSKNLFRYVIIIKNLMMNYF